MAIPFDVHAVQANRLVPIRFRRAISGDPDETMPEVDDRGYWNSEHTSIVGVMENTTVTVQIERVQLENVTNLYVVTPDKSVVTILEPADGKLVHATRMDFKFQVQDGGNPKTAEIEIRLDSATGILMGLLTVWVWKELTVDVQPHAITIADARHAAGIAPIADVEAIMDKVNEIWSTAGVTLKVAPTLQESIVLGTQGIVMDDPYPGELDTILGKYYKPNMINAYFVHQIGVGTVLGYGFSRATSWGDNLGNPKLANPGIFLGDQITGYQRDSVIYWANDLAHEIGHFFGLWHCENAQPPEEKEDTWSRRKLMHNINYMRDHATWPDTVEEVGADGKKHKTPYKYRPLLDDVGYGNLHRGCMITMKDMPQLTTDGDVKTVRKTIMGPNGPY